MKRIFTALMFSLGLCSVLRAQHVSYQSFAHYNDKVAEFERMRPVDSTDVVMLGNSITEFGGDWNKRVGGRHIRNRGIAGDDAMGIYHRLVQILPGKPKAVFLMVGINDISHDLTGEQVAQLCIKVIEKIRHDAPQTKLYVQSILPINEGFDRWKTLENKTDVVPSVNRRVRAYCQREGIEYIDLFAKFVRHGTYELRRELSVDGLHLSEQGYKQWTFILKRYLRKCGAVK